MSNYSTAEKARVRKILEYLNGLNETWAVKLHGNQFQPGLPDILCVSAGRVIFFEVKREGEKLTKWQQVIFPQMMAAGADLKIVENLGQVKRAWYH